MARDLFHCTDDMPRCEQPFAERAMPKDAPYPMVFVDLDKPDTVRTVLSEPDRRMASGPAMSANPMQKVHNLEPAKRGRHY